MLADLLKTVAPGLATAVAGPLGGAAVAAIASNRFLFISGCQYQHCLGRLAA